MKAEIIPFPIPVYTFPLPKGIYREDIDRYESHTDIRGRRKVYAVLNNGKHVPLEGKR